MLVRDVVSAKKRAVVSVMSSASVKDAINLFVPNDIGSLPVLDEHGRLIGMFTERDVLFAIHKDPSGYLSSPVRDFMSTDVITCEQSDRVHEVMGKLSEHKVGQLPVVDEGRLVGMVSVGDLIRAMFEKIEDENRHLKAYVQGSM